MLSTEKYMTEGKPKSRRQRILKIVAIIYAVPAIIGLQFGGCSKQIISHGWEVEATTLSTQSMD